MAFKEPDRINSLLVELYGKETGEALEQRLGALIEHYRSLTPGANKGGRSELTQADSILILGPGEAKNELQKRLERAGLKDRLLAIESADKLTDRQIAAKVRERFKQ